MLAIADIKEKIRITTQSMLKVRNGVINYPSPFRVQPPDFINHERELERQRFVKHTVYPFPNVWQYGTKAQQPELPHYDTYLSLPGSNNYKPFHKELNVHTTVYNALARYRVFQEVAIMQELSTKLESATHRINWFYSPYSAIGIIFKIKAGCRLTYEYTYF